MPNKKNQILENVNKVEGWLNTPVVELLYRLSSNLTENSNLVEIGSWKGKSTVLLSLACPKSAKLYAIDPHIGSHEHKELFGKVDTYQEFLKNTSRNKECCEIIAIRDKSINAIESVPEEIDFLWIDGSHDYDDVKSDFELYFPKLRVGSYVAMHDYKWQGVKRFTWELLRSNHSIGILRRVEDTHYFVKTASPHIYCRLVNGLRYFTYFYYQLFKKKKRKLKKKFLKNKK